MTIKVNRRAKCIREGKCMKCHDLIPEEDRLVFNPFTREYREVGLCKQCRKAMKLELDAAIGVPDGNQKR